MAQSARVVPAVRVAPAVLARQAAVRPARPARSDRDFPLPAAAATAASPRMWLALLVPAVRVARAVPAARTAPVAVAVSAVRVLWERVVQPAAPVARAVPAESAERSRVTAALAGSAELVALADRAPMAPSVPPALSTTPEASAAMAPQQEMAVPAARAVPAVLRWVAAAQAIRETARSAVAVVLAGVVQMAAPGTPPSPSAGLGLRIRERMAAMAAMEVSVVTAVPAVNPAARVRTLGSRASAVTGAGRATAVLAGTAPKERAAPHPR